MQINEYHQRDQITNVYLLDIPDTISILLRGPSKIVRADIEGQQLNVLKELYLENIVDLKLTYIDQRQEVIVLTNRKIYRADSVLQIKEEYHHQYDMPAFIMNVSSDEIIVKNIDYYTSDVMLPFNKTDCVQLKIYEDYENPQICSIQIQNNKDGQVLASHSSIKIDKIIYCSVQHEDLYDVIYVVNDLDKNQILNKLSNRKTKKYQESIIGLGQTSISTFSVLTKQNITIINQELDILKQVHHFYVDPPRVIYSNQNNQLLVLESFFDQRGLNISVFKYTESQKEILIHQLLRGHTQIIGKIQKLENTAQFQSVQSFQLPEFLAMEQFYIHFYDCLFQINQITYIFATDRRQNPLVFEIDRQSNKLIVVQSQLKNVVQIYIQLGSIYLLTKEGQIFQFSDKSEWIYFAKFNLQEQRILKAQLFDDKLIYYTTEKYLFDGGNQIKNFQEDISDFFITINDKQIQMVAALYSNQINLYIFSEDLKELQLCKQIDTSYTVGGIILSSGHLFQLQRNNKLYVDSREDYQFDVSFNQQRIKQLNDTIMINTKSQKFQKRQSLVYLNGLMKKILMKNGLELFDDVELIHNQWALSDGKIHLLSIEILDQIKVVQNKGLDELKQGKDTFEIKFENQNTFIHHRYGRYHIKDATFNLLEFKSIVPFYNHKILKGILLLDIDQRTVKYSSVVDFQHGKTLLPPSPINTIKGVCYGVYVEELDTNVIFSFEGLLRVYTSKDQAFIFQGEFFIQDCKINKLEAKLISQNTNNLIFQVHLIFKHDFVCLQAQVPCDQSLKPKAKLGAFCVYSISSEITQFLEMPQGQYLLCLNRRTVQILQRVAHPIGDYFEVVLEKYLTHDVDQISMDQQLFLCSNQGSITTISFENHLI